MKVVRWLAGVGLFMSFGTLWGGGYATLRGSLPEVAGESALGGLSERVDIVRDAHAVPHIYARSEEDAYFALGFVHAQDRFWQMELGRRAGSGRLSELFGERTLKQDRLFRALGLRRAAVADWSVLDGAYQRLVHAYARGVNAWLGDRRSLPAELRFLRVQPEPWEPIDSLVFLKVMAWNLSGNWRQELWRAQMAAALSPERVEELDPPYPGDSALGLGELWARYRDWGVRFPSARSEGERLGALLPELGMDRALGSNNWGVAGTRTRSGKPLLANDPHLGLTAPSQWYLAHLHAPGLNVTGATLPALPGIILGRNDRVAWAFTNTLSDTQDLYLEKLVSPNGGQYLTPEGPRAFQIVPETIRVRGEADVELLVRSTRHGPVISDVNESAGRASPPGCVLAMSWAALAPGDLTIGFPLQVARARSAEELLGAARDFHSPQQNIVYADTAGHVGFIAAGRVPQRHAENALRGLMPAPGWIPGYDWDGFLPFEELPEERDPSSGRIVTANQKITPAGYAHWLGAEWAAPYRADRIAALLDAKAEHTVESLVAIQLDVQSGFAVRLLDAMLNALPAELTLEEGEVARSLRGWDRAMQADRAEPVIFAAWVRELSRLVYEDELGELFRENWSQRPEFLLNVLTDQGGQGRWCDDVRSAEREGCGALVGRALRQALAYLSDRLGGDRSAWLWGRAHVSRAKHTPWGEVPLVSRWFNIAVPVGGDGSTVNLSGYSIRDDATAFTGSAGPGYRAVYDLADLERSVAVLNTGQSGHVLSPHYRDMNARWAAGEYVPLITERARVEQGALGTLRLRPRGKADPHE